jgi:hypothetical protein
MPIVCRQTEKRPCRHHRQIGFAGVFPYMGCTLARLARRPVGFALPRLRQTTLDTNLVTKS